MTDPTTEPAPDWRLPDAALLGLQGGLPHLRDLATDLVRQGARLDAAAATLRAVSDSLTDESAKLRTRGAWLQAEATVIEAFTAGLEQIAVPTDPGPDPDPDPPPTGGVIFTLTPGNGFQSPLALSHVGAPAAHFRTIPRLCASHHVVELEAYAPGGVASVRASLDAGATVDLAPQASGPLGYRRIYSVALDTDDAQRHELRVHVMGTDGRLRALSLTVFGGRLSHQQVSAASVQDLDDLALPFEAPDGPWIVVDLGNRTVDGGRLLGPVLLRNGEVRGSMSAVGFHRAYADVAFTGPGRWAKNAGRPIRPTHEAETYVLNCSATDYEQGFTLMDLVVGSRLLRLSDDAFSNSRAVFDCTAEDQDRGPTGNHSDLIQAHAGANRSAKLENRVYAGVHGTLTKHQAIYLADVAELRSFAFVDVSSRKVPGMDPNTAPFCQINSPIFDSVFHGVDTPHHRWGIRATVTNCEFKGSPRIQEILP